MILGLTHEASGNSLQRLPVTTKVSIGEAPNKAKGKNYPSRLDHFQFLEKTMDGNEAVWMVDEDVTKAMIEAYGENPREVGIVLLDDDPENVFKTNLAWWSATEWQCKGSLVQIEDHVFEMRAIRKTEKHPEGEPWPGNYKYTQGDKKGKPVEPCGDGCPDLEEGRCKPSGDLYFILEKFPTFGGVCRIHTTSYRSIRNIANGLQQIRSLLGGRLGGIRVTLKVAPEKVTYDGDNGKKSSTAHILSLNLAAETLPKLVEKMTEFSKLFQDTRKMLGGRTIVMEEDDDERAPEIAGEFYPDNAERQNALPPGPPRAEIPAPGEVVQKAVIHRLCVELGFNQAREQMMLGQHQGRLGELEKKLLDLMGEASAPGPESEPVKTAAIAESEPAKPGPTAAPQPAKSARASAGGKKFDF